MASRRGFIQGLMAAGAGLGLGVTGLESQTAFAATSDSAGIAWYLQQMASTRAATAAELAELSGMARAAAAAAGYAASVVGAATATATMSISPRATKVGKCALVLDDQSVFVLTHEFGTGPLNRQAVQTLWTDGATIMRDLVPTAHATALAQGAAHADAAAKSMSCCTPTGAALGTCCEYDWQGLFECCAPCAFTLPAGVVFLACAAIWCNYCSAAHCKKWYQTCR